MIAFDVCVSIVRLVSVLFALRTSPDNFVSASYSLKISCTARSLFSVRTFMSSAKPYTFGMTMGR